MTLALISASIIGLILGLLGSGGSILTVPMLIFIAGRPEPLAFAESLAIVGIIAFMGALPYARQGYVDWQSALLFGLPGMAGAYGGAYLSYYLSAVLRLKLFAGVMIVMALLMIFPRSFWPTPARQTAGMTILEGLLLGGLAGCMGIGGGGLIVAALVLHHHLPMPMAVGTSLVIVTVNSAVGFARHLSTLEALHLTVSWGMIGAISSAGVLGSMAGSQLSAFIAPTRLKQLFGWNALAIGCYMLLAR